MTQTFWLEPTGQVAVGLRRYAHSRIGSSGFTCADGYHSAMHITGLETARYTDHGDVGRQTLADRELPDRDDPHWPTTCDGCDYAFTDEDQWQVWQDLIYRRTDTGEHRLLRSQDAAGLDVPVAEDGACWDAWWMPDNWRGPDGIALMVRCPGGHDWHVDSRAANCGRPDDNTHQCWVRHGDPRECRVTVDKDGDTCSAGAGSILTSNWHGFLRDGRLVVC